MMISLNEAALATGGVCFGDVLFEGVGIDTRQSLSGQLYIALQGENFDGHTFVAQAVAQGAVAVMVQTGVHCNAPEGLPLLKVANTRLALGALSAWWRNKYDIPIIGITGSNGKTTVKEMCKTVLQTWAAEQGLDPCHTVLATQGNLNNDVGLPLMLLRLHPSHRVAVFEMGMNHPGEIAYLASLAKPSVALVTNAQRAHLEGMNELSGVAKEKGSIYSASADGGTAIINADDVYADYWQTLNTSRKTLSFGLNPKADVRADFVQNVTGSHVSMQALGQEVSFNLHIPGAHNVCNALACAAATLTVGVPLSTVATGLSLYQGVKGRLQRRPALCDAVLFDDTYNANPDSVCAAIDVLANMAGKKVLVLGDMLEIGSMSAQFHDEVGGYAKSQGIDHLLALGESSTMAVHNFGAGGEHFTQPESLIFSLKKMLTKDTVVLIKGSRFMKMERISDAIAQDKTKPAH